MQNGCMNPSRKDLSLFQWQHVFFFVAALVKQTSHCLIDEYTPLFLRCEAHQQIRVRTAALAKTYEAQADASSRRSRFCNSPTRNGDHCLEVDHTEMTDTLRQRCNRKDQCDYAQQRAELSGCDSRYDAGVVYVFVEYECTDGMYKASDENQVEVGVTQLHRFKSPLQ